jgi:hypothetical protein
MTGIAKASSDVVICADGDGTYPIESLGVVVDHLIDHDLDFVSCNRYPVRAGTTIPWKLRAGVNALNLEARIVHGHKVNDILSGMWAIRAGVRDDLDLTMGDWNLSPQIKINALRSPNVRFGEFAIAQHERHGTSHQKYLATGLSHAGWILRSRFGRVATKPDDL